MSDELTLGERKHRDFIDAIIDDASVRSRYEEDPLQVLFEFGIGYDPANPPKPGDLPDPEALREARETMLEALNEGAGAFLPQMGIRNCKPEDDD